MTTGPAPAPGSPCSPAALLVVIAAELLTFGVYSFCEARWRRV